MQAVGILRIGVHIPRYRLARAAASAFWGTGSKRGSRAVANWDEDAVTMAVEAGRQCLGPEGASPDDRGERARVGTVIVASTSLPYAEKQSAALVAEALDLPESVDTVDVGSSLRSGTQALRLAADRVRATGQHVLVIVADQRLTPVQDPAETTWGDAAVAVLIGPDSPIQIRWVSNEYQTWLSHWRLAGETYGQDADSRFVSKLSRQVLGQAVERAAKAAADRGSTVTAVAVASPNGRDALTAVHDAKLPSDTPVFGPDLQQEIGYTGSAAPLLALVAAIEAASQGDVIGWASLGDGTDSALVDVTRPLRLDTPLSDLVTDARPLSYAGYLRLRGLVPGVSVAPYSSEIEQWRSVEHTARLRAVRCRGCGHVAYPPQPVCSKCQRYGELDSYPLAREGEVFTFTVEHLFPNPEGQLAMAVVVLADGVRFYAPVTDLAPEELQVGLPVRLVYRRMHLGGHFVNYFWKATSRRSSRGPKEVKA